jgi:hypothetical protein
VSDSPPQVVGLPLSEATQILTQTGVHYEVRLTAPRRFGPGAAASDSEPRVIQQRPAGTGVLLIAAAPLAPPAEG